METENAAARLENILSMVEYQLNSDDSGQVQSTLQRLMREGCSRDRAMLLIGCVLAMELSEMARHDQKFNDTRYHKNLDHLPLLPWQT